MIEPDVAHGSDGPARKRRERYSGKNPRRFEQKYKEHNPELYAEDVARIVKTGKTPAGSHRSICVREILEILDPRPGQIALDATLGYGGHAREILQRIIPGGCLWGIDVDPIEIKQTEARLRGMGYTQEELKIRRLNFAGILKLLPEIGAGFDMILADLGVSSMQLDDPKRGFTFKTEGPLDLRLNPERGEPASIFLQALSEEEISQMLHNNSDEPYAGGIAKVIIKCRNKLLTTTALADAVRRALPRARSEEDQKKVTLSVRRTFQALRIAVNDEFIMLEQFLRNLPGCLKPGGKAVILTFHSGEDNRVVRSFAEGVCLGFYARTNSDPVRATAQERYDNPRSKSAILRWVQRSLDG